MIRIAILNFVFFLLGLALGLAFGWKPDKPREAAQPPPAQPAPETLATPAPEPAEPGPIPKGPEGTYKSLAEVLASIPAEKTGTGTGTITGRVATEDGQPLAGVFVRATRRRESDVSRWKKGQGAPKDTDLEAQVLQVVSRHRWHMATRRDVQTGPDGAFALEGLSNDSYSVSAYAEGYEITPEDRQRSHDLRPGASVNFVARAIIDVPCDVVLPGGGRPDEGRIEWSRNIGGSSRGSSERWRADDPVIQLNPGTYKLTATHSRDGEEYRSGEQSVVLKAGEAVGTLTFQLKGRTGIKGRIVFPKGEEMDNTRVYAMLVPPGSTPDLDRLRRSDKNTWAHQGQDYSYSLMDLAPGTYLVGVARRYNGSIVVAQTVDVTDHTVVQDLTVPPRGPDEYVVVWVYGPDGELLQDVSVSTGRRSGSRTSSGGSAVIKREDGCLWVLHYERDEEEGWDDMEDVRYVVTVRSDTYGQKEVEYRRGETSEITIQFGEPATLEVEIVGYVGSGHEGSIDLTLEKADKAGRQRRLFPPSPSREGLGPDGRRIFDPVEPGSYEIVLLVKTAQHSSIPAYRVPVTVRPGKNRASVTMPAMYSLTVVFEDVPPDVRINLRPADSGSQWFGGNERVGKDGRVEFPRLPAGEYKIMMFAPGNTGEMRVTLSGDQEVRFEPRPLNALAVTVNDPSGYLAQAGFQSGDLVIGADGKEFEDIFQLQVAFAGMMAKGKATFTVLRGQQRLELSLDPKKMMGGGDMGGDFEPTSR